jgi:hypothetical protein
MNTRFLFATAVAGLLALSGCSPALRWREPVTLSEYSPDRYLGSNMLVAGQRRMALPDGWWFQRRQETDAERLLFWIHDTGGNSVTGALGFERVNFAVSGQRLAERFAEIGMKDFTDKVVHRTEIDNTEAFILHGERESMRWHRVTGLIVDNFSTGAGVSDITFLGDKGYFDQNQAVIYTVLNTFKVMPRGQSERKIKGAFGFRCDDGSFGWLDDQNTRWLKKGFAIAGPVDGGNLIIGVGEVSTTRFADLLKMDLFDPQEIQTTLHVAGGSYPARAVIRNEPKKKLVSIALVFKREGKDYMLDLFRSFKNRSDSMDPMLHEIPEFRTVLDRYFYFDG